MHTLCAPDTWWYLGGPEESVKSPGAGVIDGSDTPGIGAEN